ncbi:MAG: RIP metalloprotease RseP [Cellvibrio sp.]|nr:RIP metalloprotease RseP [Cellvibrio sp.]
MGILQTVLSFLVALIILVAVHEFGHFYVARRCGVKVLRFSIGFGQTLWSRTDKQGTEYSLSALPLGGYVKMLDEREGGVTESEKPFAFNNQSVWKRMAIVAAGPIANIIFAVLLLWGSLLNGEEGLIPKVNKVLPNSVAEQLGIEAKQEIVAVDGVPTPTWGELNRALAERLGETGDLEVTVVYPDSTYQYKLVGKIENWLKADAEPDPIKGLGLELYFPIAPIVGEMDKGSAAEKAGFRMGDKILSVADKPINDYREWVEIIQASPEKQVVVKVERNKKLIDISVTPELVFTSGFRQFLRSLGFDLSSPSYGRVGMGFAPDALDKSLFRTADYSIPGAFIRAVEKTWNTSSFLLLSIKKLIVGEISTKNLSGPVTIAKVAGSSAKGGLESFVAFLVMVSISLAIFNLLPIPVLDGGHLFYCLIEVIRGKPVSDRVQNWGYQLGFVLIISLTFFALYNDLTRP